MLGAIGTARARETRHGQNELRLAVGRKNHYGSKSRRGTEVAATLYTLVETAKLHHVDPTRYLTEAVRAADRGEVLFPWQLPTT
jgi:hypothetical protein